MDSGGHPAMGFEERVVATVDGLALYARDYAPMLPETGLPVLCLHGLTRNSRDFEIVAPRIAALGRRVIAPDMRGRGHSANDRDPSHYVPAVYAQDVLTLLDALSVPKAVFIGTSMGGIVTMVVATLATQRIAAVALNDMGTRIEPAGLARIGTYVGRGSPPATWEAATEATRAVVGAAYPEKLDDNAFWDVMAHRLYRERDGVIALDYDATIAMAFAEPLPPPVDLTPLFQLLTDKPVLSLRGARSDLLSAETVSHMRDVMPALMRVEVPGVGHAPTLEEPEAWDALLEFLAKAP